MSILTVTFSNDCRLCSEESVFKMTEHRRVTRSKPEDVEYFHVTGRGVYDISQHFVYERLKATQFNTVRKCCFSKVNIIYFIFLFT